MPFFYPALSRLVDWYSDKRSISQDKRTAMKQRLFRNEIKIVSVSIILLTIVFLLAFYLDSVT